MPLSVDPGPTGRPGSSSSAVRPPSAVVHLVTAQQLAGDSPLQAALAQSYAAERRFMNKGSALHEEGGHYHVSHFGLLSSGHHRPSLPADARRKRRFNRNPKRKTDHYPEPTVKTRAGSWRRS
jgi:hypothetical protein